VADIVKEVETLSEYIAGVTTFNRIWKQYLPPKYTANELSIRYLGDTSTAETSYHLRLDREYQFIYFGTSELDCIQKIALIQRKLKSKDAIQMKGSPRYMRIGSFSMSQPFMTEGSTVYAVIGVLQAQVREARDFVDAPKMANVTADIITEINLN